MLCREASQYAPRSVRFSASTIFKAEFCVVQGFADPTADEKLDSLIAEETNLEFVPSLQHFWHRIRRR